MNRLLFLALLLSAPMHATQKPETQSELVDIDISSEHNKVVDNDGHVDNQQVHTEKTVRKLKIKVTILASLREFLSGASVLIWKLVKK